MNKTVLITGGAGFIGFNAALHYLKSGDEVAIFDNFSRPGVNRHRLLLQRYGATLVKGDIRNASVVRSFVHRHRRADLILHLASQVAVTTSVKNPRDDFNINALGTFNLLESVRTSKTNAVVIFASTNKVYGGLTNHRTAESSTRYRFAGTPYGIPETQSLDFHSPYGCSKGAADQYMHDYHRIYGLRTVVCRQSCIYGPYQYGIEDQGWVAWMCAAALFNKPIRVYGNGKQVRDLLFIEDLLAAYDAAYHRARRTGGGEVYNLGGGPHQTLSVAELVNVLKTLLGRSIRVKKGGWRPGDQRVYVSDIRKARRELGWEPRIGVDEGVRRLFVWLSSNRSILEMFYKTR